MLHTSAVLRSVLLVCSQVLVVACGSSGTPADTSDAGGDSTALDASGVGDGSDAPSAPCDGGCSGGALCCSNACVVASSCSFAVTALSADAGWQNGNDWITLTGAGFAAGMKVTFGDARAPLLVRSATSAIVQTPPGTGTVDVRIALGASEATLPKAFTYRSGGLKSTWIQKPMGSIRGRIPAMAVLQDGRVLVAGGVTGPGGYNPDTATDTAELFDRATESLSPATGKMSTVRWVASAVTLLDGRVLVVGGACWQDLSGCFGDPKRADLFDPKTGTFSPAGTLNKPRAMTRAVLLVDGRVLVFSSNDPSMEVYDPATNAFTLVTPAASHQGGFATRLRDGRVLVGGGYGAIATAEVFDSDKNTFTTVGSLKTGRYWPSAHTLPDGRVVVLGGSPGACCGWTPLDSIELFDPAAATFSTAPYKLALPRFEQGSALVRDGTILVVGGFTVPGVCGSNTATIDQIDPVKGTVGAFTAFPQPISEVSAVTLQDGSVLVAGGGGCGAAPVPFIDFLQGETIK